VAWWAVQNRRFEFDNGAETATASVPLTTGISIPSPAIAPPAAVVDDSVLRMAVEVVGNSWVVLEADGKTVYSDEMVKGDRKTFEANDSFRFRTIGNAAGLSLTLNGVKIPALGDEGDVIKNKVFDRGMLERLRAGEAAPEER
jgi:cytoskeleton protein RodZ